RMYEAAQKCSSAIEAARASLIAAASPVDTITRRQITCRRQSQIILDLFWLTPLRRDRLIGGKIGSDRSSASLQESDGARDFRIVGRCLGIAVFRQTEEAVKKLLEMSDHALAVGDLPFDAHAFDVVTDDRQAGRCRFV